jgi:hypothetical protein
MKNMDEWFNNLDENTEEPQAFGFDDGVTEAKLTDVSLYESKTSSWTAIQFEFTDEDGNTDNGLRISINRKKNDGSKMPEKMWQRNVFQLMQPLILSDKNYKPVLDLDTIRQGNASVVEALQAVVDKLQVKIEKNTPEKKPDGTHPFAEYTFLKVEPF